VGVPNLARPPLNSLQKPPFQGGWGCLTSPLFQCTRLASLPSEKPPSNEGLGEVRRAGAQTIRLKKKCSFKGGTRVNMRQAARRLCKDGKVVHERFYYSKG